MRWPLLRRANGVWSDLIMQGRPCLGDLLVMKGGPCLGWVSCCGVHSTVSSDTEEWCLFEQRYLQYHFLSCILYSDFTENVQVEYPVSEMFGTRTILDLGLFWGLWNICMYVISHLGAGPGPSMQLPCIRTPYALPVAGSALFLSTCILSDLITQGQVWGFPFMVSDHCSKVSNFGTFQILDFGIRDAQPGL